MDLPRRLGPFELTRVIGTGGMGIVYEGTIEGAPVAVKVIRAELAEDAEFRARFRHEITLVQRVRSACTARVLAADADGEPPYLATEYLPGPTLSQFVRTRGPLSVGSVRTLALGLADALGAIHEAGVVHRDLKPANVILADDGPRVVDFGIAQAADVTALTRVNMVVGSPAFMSPEQISGAAVGPAADVFSWACCVAFAATGRSPFGDGPADAVMFRVRHDPANLAGVPGGLYALLAQALVKDPRRRPSVSEVLGRLLASPPAGAENVDPVDLDTAAMRVLAAGWPVSSDLAARANSRTQVVTPPPPSPSLPPPRTGPLPTGLPPTGLGPLGTDSPPAGSLPPGPRPAGQGQGGSARTGSSRRRRWLMRVAIAVVTAVVAFGVGIVLRMALTDSADASNDVGLMRPPLPAASAPASASVPVPATATATATGHFA